MLGSLTRLQRYYLLYTGGFLMFVASLAVLEEHGMPPRWIGYAFLIFTILMYAVIGIVSRTSDVSEFYVAGRRVPAFFNGMATGADWMSAASFIGLAGTLYLSGYQGLAFVVGWTGGFVLVALLLAPYLRRYGEYTIPDFLSARYGGYAIRLVAVGAAILASFIYVVAQIYGVGLITSRFVSLQFEIGVFVGLAGILVCSFLGGMRAVTWTQVAQYVILIVAYVTPVAILSWSVTGNPVPQVVYGQVLQQVRQLEDKLFDSPAEIEARSLYRERADEYARKIMQLPNSLSLEREHLTADINALKAGDAQMKDIVALEKQRRDLPHDPEQARLRWETAMYAAAERALPPVHHDEAFPGDAEASWSLRVNFLALVFCLTIGTAALPHVLMRYYTTPSVREARESVFWSLLFILFLYITAPAYAVFVKYEVFTHLVDIPIAKLPGWVAAWSKVGLVSIEDINRDGILQLAELSLNPDVVVLATPEIAGMPYVVSGLVAAGGSGGGAFNRRRPVADDHQRAIARPLLPRIPPAVIDAATPRDFQVAASRGRRPCRHGGGAEAGHDPLDGRLGLLDCRLSLLSGAGAWHILAAGDTRRRAGRHDRRAFGSDLLHLPHGIRQHDLDWCKRPAHGALVPCQLHLGGRFRGGGRVRDHRPGQPVHQVAGKGGCGISRCASSHHGAWTTGYGRFVLAEDTASHLLAAPYLGCRYLRTQLVCRRIEFLQASSDFLLASTWLPKGL